MVKGLHGNHMNNFGYGLGLNKQKNFLAIFPWEQFFSFLAFASLCNDLATIFQIHIVFGDIICCFHQKFSDKVAGNIFFLSWRPIWISVLRPGQRSRRLLAPTPLHCCVILVKYLSMSPNSRINDFFLTWPCCMVEIYAERRGHCLPGSILYFDTLIWKKRQSI